MQLISIIVPVYNVEKYLPQCIESIINQTYENLEIILVDDGSTDKSGSICDEYSEKDKRICTIHKENGGLSDARNVAIDIAKGEYLTFVDSDDYITKDYIEYLYKIIIEDNADISICSKLNFYENIQLKEPKSSGEMKKFTGLEAMENMFYQKDINPSACFKLYRKELFEGIRYPKGKLYEDLGTTYKIFFKANKVIWSPAQKYFYLQRQNSIMSKKFSANNFDRVELSKELLNFVDENCSKLHQAAVARFFVSNIQVLRELPLKDKQYINMIETISHNIKKYRKSVIYDKKVKSINRLIAIFSYLPMGAFQKLGIVYKIFNR